MQDLFIVMPDDGMDTLIGPLRAARSSIDIYVFTLSNDNMLGALQEAVARGVAVRALVDTHPSGNEDAGKSALDSLKHAGVQARPSPDYFQHLHAKSYVVDNNLALISSVNFLQDWQNTRDFGMITSDEAIVHELAATFATDWEGKQEPDSEPSRLDGSHYALPLILSPNNSREAISRFIDSAKRSLLLEEEQITDPAIIQALAARSNAGVNVQLVTNPAQEKNAGPIADLLSKAPGARVAYSTKLWLHSKLLIADGSRMIVGSVNLTEESLDHRREVSILMTDAADVARAEALALADFAASSTTPPDHHARPKAPADSPATDGHN